jgi:hydroxymethylpyrimidine pyrophosphatase-like HAD family hydrolase
MIVAFDVDGTLVTFNNQPRHEIIDLFRWFKRNGDRVIVWSGGGKDYAQHWVDKFGLNPDFVYGKYDDEAKTANVDLAIDDEFVQLGKINLKV